jgi:hypothetical protein
MMMKKTPPDLLKRGNMGLFRLLIAVNRAGPKGIATYDLLYKLGSTHHAKAFIKRAEKEGLIKRKVGKPTTPGQFAPVYNFITPLGIELLKRSL